MSHWKRKIVFGLLVLLPGLALTPVVYLVHRGTAPMSSASSGMADLSCADCLGNEYAMISGSVLGNEVSLAEPGKHEGSATDTSSPKTLLAGAATRHRKGVPFTAFESKFKSEFEIPEIWISGSGNRTQNTSGDEGVSRPLRLASIGGTWSTPSPGNRNRSGGNSNSGHDSSPAPGTTSGTDGNSQPSAPSQESVTSDPAETEEPVEPANSDLPPADDVVTEQPGEITSLLDLSPSSTETEGGTTTEETYEEPPATQPPVAVPEPGTLILLLFGLAALSFGFKSRNERQIYRRPSLS